MLGMPVLTAVAPQEYNYNNATLTIDNASETSAGAITVAAQTIAGQKTFTSVPICTVEPTEAGELTNKGYVDDAVVGIRWRTSVNRFHDFSEGDPTGLAEGNRYIASATYEDFDKDTIYTYHSLAYVAETPIEGWAVRVTDDDSPAFANQCITFNGTDWVSFATGVDHDSLIGVPVDSYTHTEINSHIDTTETDPHAGQDLRTTASPEFAAVTLASMTAANDSLILYGANTVQAASITTSDETVTLTAHGTTLTMYASEATLETTATELNLVNATSEVTMLADNIGITAETIILTGGVELGGAVIITDDTESADIGTGSLISAGGIGISKAAFIGGALNVVDETESTTTATGSVITAGGLGVAKAAFIGGAVNVTDATDSTTTATGSVITAGGIGISKAAFIGGAVNVTDATDSTTTATGSVITAGGLGVAKAAFIGGAVNVTDATESTTTATGSVITAGGAGVAKDVCIGGDLLFKDGGATGHGVFGDTELNLGTADGSIKILKDRPLESKDATVLSDMPIVIYQQGWSGNTDSSITVYDDTSTKLNLSTAGELSILTKITCEGDLTISSGTPATYALRTLNGATDAKQLNVINDTQSTSVSTGSTVLAGGVGIAKAAFIGGAVNVTDSTESTTTATGSIITAGGLGVTKAAFIGGAVNVTDSTESTTVASGSIIAAGGLGVTKAAFIGGAVNVTNTTDSTSASTGSVITAGGIGAAKRIWCDRAITGACVNGKVTAVDSAAGTTTLTVSDNQHIYVQGITTQTIKLPVLSTLTNGHTYHIHNVSTGAVTVTDSDATVIAKLLDGQRAEFIKLTTAWNISTRVPIANSTTLDVMTSAQAKIFNGLPPPTLIIKSGLSDTVATNSTVDVAFATAFPTACTSVVVTGVREAAATSYGHMVYGLSTAGFSIRSCNAIAVPCYWIATGY